MTNGKLPKKWTNLSIEGTDRGIVFVVSDSKGQLIRHKLVLDEFPTILTILSGHMFHLAKKTLRGK